MQGGVRKQEEESGSEHTSVGLYARRDFTCADGVKVGNVLTEDCLEVLFTNAFGIYFACVYPDDHVNIGADEHGNSWKGMSER